MQTARPATGPARGRELTALLLSLWPSILIVGGTLALCLHLWGVLQRAHADERERARQAAEQRASHLAEAVQHEIGASLRSLDVALLHLREHEAQDPRGFEDAAQQVLAAFPPDLLLGAVVYGPDGRVRRAVRPASAAAVDFPADADLAPRLAAGGDAMDVGPARWTGGPGAQAFVMVSRPLRRQGALVAAIGLALRPQALSTRLAALRGRPLDALAVIGRDGIAIAHSRAGEAASLRVPGDRPFLQASDGDSGLLRARSARDERPLLMAWQRLPPSSLAVVAALNEAEEYAPLHQRQAQAERHAAGLAGLALCFATGIALLMARLQRTEARSTAMFRRCRLPMLLVDPLAGRLVDGNDAAAEFYGLERRAMRGLPLSRIECAPPPGAPAADPAAPWRDGVRQLHRRGDGAPRQVEICAGTLELGGRPLLYCMVHDITERCSAEQAAAFEASRLAALLDTATDGIHILDPDGNLVQYSPSFLSMLGYTDEEARTLNVVDWDLNRTREGFREIFHQRMAAPLSFEARYVRKDGRQLDVEISSRGFSIGGRQFLYASSRDISERKAAEQQLRVAAVAFEAQEGIVVTDHDNRIVRVNRAFTEITGYTADEVVGGKPSRLKSGRHDAAFYADMWRCIRQDGFWRGEIYNRRKSGEIYPEWLTITALRGADGRITHHIATLTDITERKSAERQVRRLAFFDPLTQLPNRRLLYDRLQHALATAARTGMQGAALFIDLDDFKTLNDTRGHAVGDRLLEQVARRLERCVREHDTVARIGGDEFVVLLENIAAAEDEVLSHARTVAQGIHAALGVPHELDGQVEHSSASIGITLFDGHGGGVDDTLKRADLAMYEAKAKGRRGTRFFDPRMEAAAAARLRLEVELRQALQDGELVLYYQPQVDQQGRICAAETLVRWQHPRRGLLAPGEFIEAAERAGLIGAVGAAVLEGACARLVHWSAQPVLRDLKLAVNVSALQFCDDNFVDEVRRILDETGADPRRLELEITESALVADVDAVIGKMRALKAMGIDIALDDFGTGYSSLSYLSRMPLDQLKIDRSFVKDIEVDQHAVVICAATINLAHSLSLKVVAEGVETVAQRRMLTSTYPCDRMQGYLFGRPVPAAEFETAVRASVADLAAEPI